MTKRTIRLIADSVLFAVGGLVCAGLFWIINLVLEQDWGFWDLWVLGMCTVVILKLSVYMVLIEQYIDKELEKE